MCWQVNKMMIYRSALAALIAALGSVVSGGILCADTLQFGVVGSPIDLSANVSEAIRPGSTVFQDSERLAPRSASTGSVCEVIHAGAIPNATPVSTDTPSVKSNTGQEGVASIGT